MTTMTRSPGKADLLAHDLQIEGEQAGAPTAGQLGASRCRHARAR